MRLIIAASRRSWRHARPPSRYAPFLLLTTLFEKPSLSSPHSLRSQGGRCGRYRCASGRCWLKRSPVYVSAGASASGASLLSPPLLLPFWLGQVSLLEFLLAQEGLCVDVASRNGYTALRYCVQAGWAAGTHLLLAKGRADPEVADQDGITPLQVESEIRVTGNVRESAVDVEARAPRDLWPVRVESVSVESVESRNAWCHKLGIASSFLPSVLTHFPWASFCVSQMCRRP